MAGSVWRPDLLRLRTADDLRRLNPSAVGAGAVTGDVLLHWLKLVEGYWRHDGDPQRPHAELTSGLCSNGYVNVPRLLVYANACQAIGRALVDLLSLKERSGVDWVVGSDHAAATLSFSVAGWLNCRHDFTERDPNLGQRWVRHDIASAERVVHVEEIVTTGNTVRQVRQALARWTDGPVRILPCVLTAVRRGPPSIVCEG
ncbi:MAG: hypothetical protein ABIJ46_03510, partial [bacterium]